MNHLRRDSLFTRFAIVALFLSGPLLVFWLCYSVLGWALWISVLAALLGGTAGCTVVAIVLLTIMGSGWALGLFREKKPPTDTAA